MYHDHMLSLSLAGLTAIFPVARVSRYQNDSIPDFIGSKDDGGAVTAGAMS